MNIEIKLQITTDDSVICEKDVLHLDKPHDQLECLGLSLSEAKTLLSQLQASIVTAQAKTFANKQRHCKYCGKCLLSKGYASFRFRSPFGDVMIPSPRFYCCACKPNKIKTFSPLTELFTEHIAPEFLYLESKWASLVSYGVTVDLLKEVLPIGATLNAQTVRNHLHTVSNRMETELGEERPSFSDGVSPRELTALPVPEGPIVVGIDGGYVRDRDKQATHFEVMVGQSLSTDRGNRYFGLVQSHDDKPKRRLQNTLNEQGFQMNQDITFMTDGGDTVRSMAMEMLPCAEHILDWFHITMRLTILKQYAKGLVHHNPEDGEKVKHDIKRIKGFLWNGNLYEALPIIEWLADDLDTMESDYGSIKALRKAVIDLYTYIRNNAHSIPNYAERHRYGERVSTAFAESTVNVVIGKRYCKKQQMRWTKKGAHLLLQTRTRTLDGTLRGKFEQWYPGLAAKNDEISEMPAAA